MLIKYVPNGISRLLQGKRPLRSAVAYVGLTNKGGQHVLLYISKALSKAFNMMRSSQLPVHPSCKTVPCLLQYLL